MDCDRKNSVILGAEYRRPWIGFRLTAQYFLFTTAAAGHKGLVTSRSDEDLRADKFMASDPVTLLLLVTNVPIWPDSRLF